MLVDDRDFHHDIVAPCGKDPGLRFHLNEVIASNFNAERTITNQPAQSPSAFFNVIDFVFEHDARIGRNSVNHTLPQPMQDFALVCGINEDLHSITPGKFVEAGTEVNALRIESHSFRKASWLLCVE